MSNSHRFQLLNANHARELAKSKENEANSKQLSAAIEEIASAIDTGRTMATVYQELNKNVIEILRRNGYLVRVEDSGRNEKSTIISFS